MNEQNQPPASLEEQLRELQRQITQAQDNANTTHQELLGNPGLAEAQKAELRDIRDVALRVADQRIALLQAQVQLATFYNQRGAREDFADEMNRTRRLAREMTADLTGR